MDKLNPELTKSLKKLIERKEILKWLYKEENNKKYIILEIK
jgi:hypothetical protein